ncbi:MAG: cytotoxic translational repressor of toxin-antitoxin stability system [Bacteriovoracia bacterium]
MWLVTIKSKVVKDVRNRKKIPIDVENAVFALISELRFGPAVNWPNYGKLKNQGKNKDLRHCHLQKGKPTWVACWSVDRKNYIIEVYYVGTHEKAPY